MTARPVVIVGCGGHARVVADICRLMGREIHGFLDRQGTRTSVHAEPVLGGDELLDDSSFVDRYDFVIGIAHQHLRRRLGELLQLKGAHMTNAVHPRAVVATEVAMGAGVVVVAGSVVNPGAVLGDLVIINTGATVDHDCRLGMGVHVGPGAHLAGSVVCGDFAFVGTGAIVTPGRTLGARSVVGAGAVVVSDFGSDVTVAGCPARVIKNAGC